MQFEDNGALLGTPQTLDGSGRASLTTSDIAVGSHTIEAVYTSDVRDFDGGTGSLDQTVDRALTTLVYTRRDDLGLRRPGHALRPARANERRCTDRRQDDRAHHDVGDLHVDN